MTRETQKIKDNDNSTLEYFSHNKKRDGEAYPCATHQYIKKILLENNKPLYLNPSLD